MTVNTGLEALTVACSRAMNGVSHVNRIATLDQLRYLSQLDRDNAMKIYAALIGERRLPARIGRYARP